MKLSKISRVRMVSGMFAAMLAILMIMSSSMLAQAQTIENPTMTVGDSAYFGGIVDIGKDYQDEIDEALKEFKDMGFTADVKANGGAGSYIGWEVISDSADIGGYTCYDVAINGAAAIDFGIDARVKGSMSEYGTTITADAKANGFVKAWATLDGHMYMTVDELAIAKLQFTIKAEGEFKANMDAEINYGTEMTMKADASGSAEDVQFDFTVTFNPPLDIYQFPIAQGETWYVPHEDTEVSGSLTARGTLKYNVDATVPGEAPVKESETKNLATEIGTQTFSQILPGGEPEWYWDSPYGGGTQFTCTRVMGDVFVIEMDMFGMMDNMPFPGTRQFDFFDPENMMPSMGMQFDRTKGMMTGVAMDGVEMTETVTKSVVDNFIDAPLKTVTAETGGSGGGFGGIMIILLIVVVVVVVVVVVAMVVMKKKTPPTQQYPQPYPGQEQQMYGPQSGYEQPPPQYTPPPQPDQYGNYPPPPPPPGQ